MGQHKERLDRLKANQQNFFVSHEREAMSIRRNDAAAATEDASASALKAARTEGFEGEYGDVAAAALTDLHKEIDRFAAHQAALSKAIEAANQALQAAADSTGELPDDGLSPDQQKTVTMAQETNSPVQVSPGVMMTSAEAKQYYLDQAAVAQEEAAAKVTATLDATLQDIMDTMPVSDYDEPEPTPDPSGDDGTGGDREVDGPTVNGSGSGSGGTGGTGGTGGGGGGGGTGGIVGPPFVYEPPRVDPPYVDPPYVDPPYVDDPRFPDTDDTDPNIDGGTGGTVPGGGTGGIGGTGGVGGGTTGGGSVGGGLSGVLGGAAGSAGAAGLANRLGGGAGLLGGAGGIGGVGGAGSASGAGAAGVVAQQGGANGGRGAVAAGGAAGGGAGAGRNSKRNRRRGQDLMAFQVEPDDDDITPDLGAAGAAGRSSSDGREELTW